MEFKTIDLNDAPKMFGGVKIICTIVDKKITHIELVDNMDNILRIGARDYYGLEFYSPMIKYQITAKDQNDMVVTCDTLYEELPYAQKKAKQMQESGNYMDVKIEPIIMK